VGENLVQVPAIAASDHVVAAGRQVFDEVGPQRSLIFNDRDPRHGVASPFDLPHPPTINDRLRKMTSVGVLWRAVSGAGWRWTRA
jgi:hypothetical protein